MSVLASLRSVLSALFHRSRVENEMDEELRAHIQDRVSDLERSGVPPSEAQRRARLEFGGYQKFKEECREAIGTHFIETLAQDFNYSLRMLRKSPAFTAVAVLTLALGIGANTTMFSAISAILLRKPPVKNPDTLCAVASADKIGGGELVRASAPDFLSWQEQNGVFESMAAVESGRSFTLTGKNSPQAVAGDFVTPDYFRIIGIPPLLGRAFLPSESQAGNNRVAILSYGLWRERYDADLHIVGKRLEIGSVPYTIVGVMPRGAALPLPWIPPRLWTPLVFGPGDLTPAARDNHYINMVLARLKRGVTVQQAQTNMNSVAERLAAEYPATNRRWGATVVTLQQYRIRKAEITSALMMLFAMVGFVLLIACANVAGLLLSRGATRWHEMAVRVAIGAGRARLIRQLLTESLLIGFAGGAGGLVLSLWGIRLLRAGFVNLYGAHEGVYLDQRTLLFTLAIAIVSAIVFGLVPAFQISRVDPGDALSESGRAGSTSFAHTRLRSVLVTGEIALTIALLAGAGVAARETVRRFSTPAGFNPHHVVIASLHLDEQRYGKAAARTAFFEQVSEKLQNVPGVESAALDNCVPFNCDYGTSFTIVGQPPTPKELSADYAVVGPGYLQTMRIPLIKGREFADSDNSQAPTVAIVSQGLVRRYFPKGDVIGKWIEAATIDAKPAEIVGIVGNVGHFGGQTDPDPQIYECDLQFPFTAFSGTSLVVRSHIAASALVPMLRRAVWSVDGNQPVDSVQTMDDLFSESAGGWELMGALLGTFAGIALVLASVGLYGVIAYSVSQRTREIGIRIALGARREDVLGLVLQQGTLLAGIGSAIGFFVALPMPRIFSALLSGFPGQGPLVALAVTPIVVIISLLATYIPARRAMKVDPMIALRHE
jgi:putative ABC transport system permease protein